MCATFQIGKYSTRWANRRLLLTGAEHLSTKQWRRLTGMLDTTDPTNEIGAAWGVKERLRMLLREREPSKIQWRLADFDDAALDADMAETSRLAKTINLVAGHPGRLTYDVTNARGCRSGRLWA